MKDYYKGMEGQIPDEAKTDHARLALIELPVMDEHGNPKTPETPTGKRKPIGEKVYLFFNFLRGITVPSRLKHKLCQIY